MKKTEGCFFKFTSEFNKNVYVFCKKKSEDIINETTLDLKTDDDVFFFKYSKKTKASFSIILYIPLSTFQNLNLFSFRDKKATAFYKNLGFIKVDKKKVLVFEGIDDVLVKNHIIQLFFSPKQNASASEEVKNEPHRMYVTFTCVVPCRILLLHLPQRFSLDQL